MFTHGHEKLTNVVQIILSVILVDMGALEGGGASKEEGERRDENGLDFFSGKKYLASQKMNLSCGAFVFKVSENYLCTRDFETSQFVCLREFCGKLPSSCSPAWGIMGPFRWDLPRFRFFRWIGWIRWRIPGGHR